MLTFSIGLKQDPEFYNMIFKIFKIQSKTIQHVKKQENLNSHGKDNQWMPKQRPEDVELNLMKTLKHLL